MHSPAEPKSILSMTVTASVQSACQGLWCHSHIPTLSSCTEEQTVDRSHRRNGIWEDYIWFDCRDFCLFLYCFKTLCVREKMLKGKRVNQILCMNYLVERLKSLLLGFPVTTDTDTDSAVSPSKAFPSIGMPGSMAVPVLRKGQYSLAQLGG